MIHVTSVCCPVLCRVSVGSAGGQGLELTMSVRASVPDDVTLHKAEESVLVAFKETIAAVLDGRIA